MLFALPVMDAWRFTRVTQPSSHTALHKSGTYGMINQQASYVFHTLVS
jgi:hypothetical protein